MEPHPPPGAPAFTYRGSSSFFSCPVSSRLSLRFSCAESIHRGRASAHILLPTTRHLQACPARSTSPPHHSRGTADNPTCSVCIPPKEQSNLGDSSTIGVSRQATDRRRCQGNALARWRRPRDRGPPSPQAARLALPSLEKGGEPPRAEDPQGREPPALRQHGYGSTRKCRLRKCFLHTGTMTPNEARW